MNEQQAEQLIVLIRQIKNWIKFFGILLVLGIVGWVIALLIPFFFVAS